MDTINTHFLAIFLAEYSVFHWMWSFWARKWRKLFKLGVFPFSVMIAKLFMYIFGTAAVNLPASPINLFLISNRDLDTVFGLTI